MSNLFVIGTCYAEADRFAQALFDDLTKAGYVLAYNNRSKNSMTILKEIEEEEPEEPEENETA